jgi:uncharacterized caspase-like protein
MMRRNHISRARLLTCSAAAALVLLLAALGIVKTNAMRQVRPAGTEITSPGGGIGIAAVNTAKDQDPAIVPRAQTTAGPARSIALVIGNGRYPDDEAPLRHPVVDAHAMADEMRARGFDLTSGENLTKQGMVDAFSRFAAKAEPGATAFIFFSGYGIQSGLLTYLIPVNAEIWRESDVPRDGLRIDPLLADLHARGAATKLVVIDASRRNPFERRFRGGSIGIAPISTPKGSLIIYSAAPGQVAHDNDTGVFVGELITQMRRDGTSLEDAFNRTRTVVARASHEEQVPGVFSSLTEDLSLPPPPGTAAQ